MKYRFYSIFLISFALLFFSCTNDSVGTKKTTDSDNLFTV